MTRRIEKPWGEELLWALTDRYAAKILRVRAGCRLSLQKHREKDESLLVLSGSMRLIEVDDAGVQTVRVLLPGDTAHIPPGRVHRFEAAADCEIVEVSTPEIDDVVRIEDDWGRVHGADEGPDGR